MSMNVGCPDVVQLYGEWCRIVQHADEAALIFKGRSVRFTAWREGEFDSAFSRYCECLTFTRWEDIRDWVPKDVTHFEVRPTDNAFTFYGSYDDLRSFLPAWLTAHNGERFWVHTKRDIERADRLGMLCTVKKYRDNILVRHRECGSGLYLKWRDLEVRSFYLEDHVTKSLGAITFKAAE